MAMLPFDEDDNGNDCGEVSVIFLKNSNGYQSSSFYSPLGNGDGDDCVECDDAVFEKDYLHTIHDHDHHFITDSACNALYVFSDKTLRAQSENQSPR